MWRKIKMKKSLLSLFVIALASLTAFNVGVTEDKKKPIIVDKLAFAEEIIEYTIEEENEGADIANDITNDDTNNETPQVDENNASICVFGKAKISLSPDTAKISAKIETFNSDMASSKEENVKIFECAVGKLKDLAIQEDKISLDYFCCQPSYDFEDGRKLTGYFSTTTFSFEINDLNNIDNCIDNLIACGVTNICDVNYYLSNIDEQYTNALKNALDNARAKAEKILMRDDLKLKSVREEIVYSNNFCRAFIERLTAPLLGKVDIEARVLAEFE